jgi:hypothetical protein
MGDQAKQGHFLTGNPFKEKYPEHPVIPSKKCT